MKTLYLIRHAKSDWNNPELKDSERHLNERGYAAANYMSGKFNVTPDLIISSPAIRAISTAIIFAGNLNYSPNKILIKEELYETGVTNYLSVIHSIDNTFSEVLLFAHNPTISNLAQQLTQALPLDMPTCAIAQIKFDINDWKKVITGQLISFEYPKKGED
ncbi:MAG: histidine phosphatase family protein [Bacteroidota bacterium]